MKYDVGDVVKLKSLNKIKRLCDKEYSSELPWENIKTKSDDFVQIEAIDDIDNDCFVEELDWLITDKMIEREATTKEKIDNGYSDIDYGDRVRVNNPHYGWVKGILEKNPHAEQMILKGEDDDLGAIGVGDNTEIEKVEETSLYTARNFEATIEDSNGIETIDIDKEIEKLEQHKDEFYDLLLRKDDFMPPERNYETYTVEFDGVEMDTCSISDLFIENNKEDDDMLVDELDGSFKIVKKDNGYVVEMETVNEEVEIVADHADEGVHSAIVDILQKVTNRVRTEERKENELNRKEEKMERLQNEIEELKGE